MRYRGALEINREVREAERQQLLLRASEWSYVSRPPQGAMTLPLRRWLAVALHGLAIRIEQRASVATGR